MEIIEKIVIKNPCYKSGRKIVPKGIMIHSVGVSQPDPGVFVNQFNSEGAKACVHGFIGIDEIYQTLPLNHRAWHCGGDGNNTHIGIEMTEPNTITYVGGSSFIDEDEIKTKVFIKKTYNNAVMWFAHICKEYGFNPLEPGIIISHSEGFNKGIASNHADVEHIWDKYGLSMDQFRIDINKKMEEDIYMVEQKSFLINGEERIVNTILKDGKNYVEVRGFCSHVGMDVGYDTNTKKVTIDTIFDNIKIKVNGVIREVKRIFYKDNNFIKLRDLEDDKIKVSYDEIKKIPCVEVE